MQMLASFFVLLCLPVPLTSLYIVINKFISTKTPFLQNIWYTSQMFWIMIDFQTFDKPRFSGDKKRT